MLSINELHLPALLLYAETHFKFFRFFPNLLFKKEPEVLFDVPRRIGPDTDLPILLLINEVNRFEAEPVEVAVTVSRTQGKTLLYRFEDCGAFEINHPFKFCQRAFIFTVSRGELPEGQLFINATVTLYSGKKRLIVFNDNFNTSSRRAFSCYRSEDSLPGSEWCSYGDLHFHSQFSQSHVEFGPPLVVIDRMAKSCGLRFVGITDHSYDLSCKIDNYLVEDPRLERWNLQKQLLADRASFSTILLHGEEISCANAAGATVHLGALGLSEFIPGSGDGARRKRQFTRQLTVSQAIDGIRDQGGISFAAHPCSTSGSLQRLFLGRGSWAECDLQQGIDALQAFNDGFGQSWVRAKRLWLRLLQQGYRIPLIAGNDAHGDFNRYRAIKVPFLSISEDFQRFMGCGKTGIYHDSASSQQILTSLRNGASFISTGPYLSINYSADPESHAVSTCLQTPPKDPIHLHCISSREFGQIRKITLFSGSTDGAMPERELYSSMPQSTTYEVNLPVGLPSAISSIYVRAEVETLCRDGTTCAAYTNCCFF